jgi:hypothetical protein
MADHDKDDLEPPLRLEHDVADVDRIVARIATRFRSWKPGTALDLGDVRWTPSAMALKPKRALYVHLTTGIPNFVARRVRAAAAAGWHIHVATEVEGLYDADLLRLLAEVDGNVYVIGEDGPVPDAVYYLAALGDHGIPVYLDLRRHLATASWERRANGTNHDKGRRLEGLLAFLLGQTEDYRIFERNFRGDTDEIDITIQVDRATARCWYEPGVPFLLVEAKNRAETTGSHVVALLSREIENRRGRVRLGLLFTTSGFSPEAKAEEGKNARTDICVAMFEPDDIVAWINAGDPDKFLEDHVIRAMLR